MHSKTQLIIYAVGFAVFAVVNAYLYSFVTDGLWINLFGTILSAICCVYMTVEALYIDKKRR